MQEADKRKIDKKALWLLARDMRVDFVDLDAIDINKDASSILDYDIASRYSVVPFDVKNNLLYLAMQNPDDIFLIDEIKVFAQMEIKPFLAEIKQIERVIDCLCRGDIIQGMEINADCSEQAGVTFSEDSRKPLRQDYCGDSDYEALIREYPLIGEIVAKALKLNACRVIVESGMSGMRIQYKAGGRLVKEDHFNLLQYKSALQKLSEVSAQQSFSCGRMSVDGQEIEIRVSHLPVINGDRYVLKISASMDCYGINELGLTENEQDAIQCMIKKKSGLIIVTGPSGSGRTSTCYAILKNAAADSSIIVIEDTSGLRFDGASRIGTSGKPQAVSALIKSANEQDADVLFVDTSINTAEFKYMINMALSGKLIIIIMNFSSVFNTIAGLINMEIKPGVIASALNGIISQRLVRRLCPECGGKGIRQGVVIRRSGGRGESPICNACEGRGCKGWIGIFEVFEMNREYKQFLLKNNDLDMIESHLKNERSTFRNNYIRMINDEIISNEDIVSLGFEEDLN